VGGNRKLWRFSLTPEGRVELGSRKELFDWRTDRGPDGLALDDTGRIFAAAGFNFPSLPAETSDQYKSGIYVISPEGGLIDFLPVPADMITNCTFGGADRRTLFVTAGHKLWSIRVATPGRKG
jgi:gluconolactonase